MFEDGVRSDGHAFVSIINMKSDPHCRANFFEKLEGVLSSVALEGL